MSLNMNQSSCTNSVSEDDIYLSLYPVWIFHTWSGFLPVRALWQHLFLSTFGTKTTRNKYMSKSIDWLESWRKLMFVKWRENVEHFRNATCSERWSEQAGDTHTACLYCLGRRKGLFGLHMRQRAVLRVRWTDAKSSRAAWLDIWESRIAVSFHSRFECFYYSYEANTFSFVLTLVCCSAHPPPLLPQCLLRSHLLLRSPGLHVSGTNTRCYLSVQHPAPIEPFLQDWVTQHCCNGVWLTSGTMTLPILA